MVHHLGFKRFICNFCGKEFAQNQYLKEHINIHTNKFPYLCKFPGCTAKFKQRSRLCVHKKKMHQASEKSPDTDNGLEEKGYYSNNHQIDRQNSNHDEDLHIKFNRSQS